MAFRAVRFDLETRTFALVRLTRNQTKLQQIAVAENTPEGLYERKKRKFEAITKARSTSLVSAEAEALSATRHKMRTAFLIDLLMNIVHQLFVCLVVFADSGIELANEQLAIVYEIWACNLSSFVNDPNIYPMVKEVIYRMYAIVFRGKINDVVLPRRFGKSFSTTLAMACMIAVCPAYTCCILNLAGHAALTNMGYVINFVRKLQMDPHKRIRCSVQKVEKNQKLYVQSHYQTLRAEMDDTVQAARYLNTLQYNTFESFPNMAANEGEQRFYSV